MKYNFDEVIDRRYHPYSYSMKWSRSQMVAEMVGMKEIPEDSIAIYTADMDFRCAQPIIDAMHSVAEHGIFGYSTEKEVMPYYEAL